MGIEDIKKKGENSTTSTTEETTSTTNNNDQALEQTRKELAEAKERAEEAEFSNSFDKLATKYPLATEHKDTIREKVKSGYSVDDAVISVLQKEGKLKTQEDIQREENNGEGLGGSATHGRFEKAESKDPSVEEAAKAFQEAEARGEIFLS